MDAYWHTNVICWLTECAKQVKLYPQSAIEVPHHHLNDPDLLSLVSLHSVTISKHNICVSSIRAELKQSPESPA